MDKKIIVGGVFLLFGTVVIIVASWIIWRDNASRYWPTVDGVVTSSKVVKESSRRSRRNRRNRTTSYRADIKYHYEVEGKKMSGDSLYSVQTWGSQNAAQAKKSEYPVGKTVTVYYDPSSHKLSLLEPGGLSWWFYIFPLMGLVFTGAGVMALRGKVRVRY